MVGAATPRTSSAGRCATRSSGRAGDGLGPRDRRPARADARGLPRRRYENRFGTVAVRRGGVDYEITTFRSDHDYADFRRPHRVEFGTSLEADLARRDFTVNAIAWGAESPARPAAPRLRRPVRRPRATSRPRATPRASATAGTRFEEDALRMLRAVRLAATLGFDDRAGDARRDPRRRAPLAAHLSGERIAAELERLLAAERPSVGLRLMADTGLLAAISPELAAQRGMPQNKIPGEDLWDHTLRTVDAAPADRPVVRLAGARSTTSASRRPRADGHFYGHETRRRRAGRGAPRPAPRARAPTRARSSTSSASTCSATSPRWSDAAVRRFIGKVGPDAIDDLFALREADNVGSGAAARRRRPRRAAARGSRRELAAAVAARPVGARDRRRRPDRASSGSPPGPALGRILEALLERVIDDPALNERADAPAPRPVDARGGRPMIELLLEAERALGVGLARPGGAAVSPGRASTIRGTRSRSSGSRASRSSGATSGRPTPRRQRALAIDPDNPAAQHLVDADWPRCSRAAARRCRSPTRRSGDGARRRRRAIPEPAPRPRAPRPREAPQRPSTASWAAADARSSSPAAPATSARSRSRRSSPPATTSSSSTTSRPAIAGPSPTAPRSTTGTLRRRAPRSPPLLERERIEAILHCARPLARRRVGRATGHVLPRQRRRRRSRCSRRRGPPASAASSSARRPRSTACPTRRRSPRTRRSGRSTRTARRSGRSRPRWPRYGRGVRPAQRSPALLQRRRRHRAHSARTTTPRPT